MDHHRADHSRSLYHLRLCGDAERADSRCPPAGRARYTTDGGKNRPSTRSRRRSGAHGVAGDAERKLQDRTKSIHIQGAPSAPAAAATATAAGGCATAAATGTVYGGNSWIANGLLAKSTHTFRLAYVLQSGSRSDLSRPSSGTTWGEDRTGPDGVPDGLPDDWQGQYWGVKAALWPAGNVDSDGDGVSNAREFLAGTNPLDPNSVLKMRFTWNRFGRLLNWNTQPGFVYQVQVSNDLADWTNFGSARFAAGTTDSVAVSGSRQAEYFRVLRVR